MNVTIIVGSARTGSLNAQLGQLVASQLPEHAVTTVANLPDLPFYNADVEALGTPAPVAELRATVAAADLLVVITPEYNGTVPGLLGNAVDWLSRPHHASVLHGKPTLVLSASPTPYGAARAAEHLRTVLTS